MDQVVEAGKDTRGSSQLLAGGSTQPAALRAPSIGLLSDEVLAQLRTAGLERPRPPQRGREWTPATEPEQHLLREACRLDRVRRMLLEDIGRRAQEAARLRRMFAGRSVRQDQDGGPAPAGACPLPPHELEVIAAAAAGETLEQTSGRLILSYDTIRTRRKRAVHRLGVRSVTQAVALLVAGRWITSEQISGGGVR
ncbi:LuxR C-terminal-related transcriptional regulator [Streptomyces sp. NPDC050988]|uniref:helix-turn-helix transcriptional regulator n=1 Tax=Streptomyces sp. NPDC050988 TaxID=3365637 RepID=UPI00379A7F76